ncbi:CoA-binding protein [Bizionia sediminis]|uniref:CoA-binding protein n=1 Tax=Bizionia sediminis TaxID=1737064 RepID=A0ABW5KPW6_9FLAO
MSKKTLVVGASLNPDRYSNIAIKRLVKHQHEVVAFGLRSGQVAGVTISTTWDAFANIHTVTLYLNPERQKAYYQAILAVKPKRVVFNPGTENPEFYALLKAANIKSEVACTLVLLATNQY